MTRDPRRVLSIEQNLGLPCYERALLLKVHRAFKDSIQPSADNIVSANEYSREETSRVLAGRTWRGMALSAIKNDPTEFAECLPYLTPDAVAYYIPALMTSTLNIIHGSTARFFILFHLAYRETGRDYSIELAERLTLIQKHAVFTYLRYTEAVDGILEGDYPGLLAFWEREIRLDGACIPATLVRDDDPSYSSAAVPPKVLQKNVERGSATGGTEPGAPLESQRLRGLIVSAFPRGQYTHEIGGEDVDVPAVSEQALTEIEIYREVRDREHVVYVSALYPALSPAAFLYFLPGLMIAALEYGTFALSILSVNMLPFSLGFPTCDGRYRHMLSDRLSLLSAEQKSILAQFWLYARTYNAGEMGGAALRSSTFWDQFL